MLGCRVKSASFRTVNIHKKSIGNFGNEMHMESLYICLAMTSQAVARRLCRPASHSSRKAWCCHHCLLINKQNTTQAPCSWPPASLAALITFGVMTLLCGRVTNSVLSSTGTHCSMRWRMRSATSVTRAGGMAD